MSQEHLAQELAAVLADLDPMGFAPIFGQAKELDPDDESIPTVAEEYVIEALAILRRVSGPSRIGQSLDQAELCAVMAAVFKRYFEEEFSPEDFRPIAPRVQALLGVSQRAG